ncbi:UPF0280 family protein [Mesorhizobium sp. CAU 1732]|uniref:UPF0280 family protein n=1 Tax=Mesorhizobium sp. CAU 1732 TaxID=3140358 RepID=UPI0032608E59
MDGPQAAMLTDGRRLHLNHGPIDLIIEAFGDPAECAAAYTQAKDRFDTVLTELVTELPQLRKPAAMRQRPFQGPTARRMEQAVCRLADRFITPMAAVAGSVADEVLAAMIQGRTLDRAYVNNGGDIAVFLSQGAEMKAAIAGTGHGMGDRITIRSTDPVRGVATSGWRGRSHSLGIADAVTVLARDAAAADAAATLIANAVDLPGHPAIERKPAHELAPDSDLGDRLVTTAVGVLSSNDVAEALRNGLVVAEEFVSRGLIVSAALFLDGQSHLAGTLAAVPTKTIEEAHA